MKKRLVKFFTLLFLITCIILVSVSSNIIIEEKPKEPTIQEELEKYSGKYDTKKIVLQNTNEVTAKKLAERFNAKLRITSDGSYATLTLPGELTINDIVKDKNNSDILSLIAPDYQANMSEISEERVTSSSLVEANDEYYSSQSYLNYLNLQSVWNYSKGSNITVAVIDTGIDTDHPEFEGRISEYSYNATLDKIVKDYTTSDGSYDWSIVEDQNGHGTAVTGVIAAAMNNNIGITGIAPEVNIITIKAECDMNGNFKNTSDLVFGLYYAIERNVQVVNMSFGTKINSFAEATQLAVDSDIICVAAAGNDSTATLTYPAADKNVIGVGSLKENSWELADYSNYGENTDVVAPGTVFTTSLNGTYKIMNGTSFASPIVAALIALYLSNNSYLEFDDVTEVLYASSYDLGDKGKDFYYGYGAVDANALVVEEKGTITFNYLTDEIETTKQVFVRNHTLQNIPEPERLYAVFDGWYYDIHCKEEIGLYTDVWTDDLTLYCNWVNEDDTLPYTYQELDDGTIEITGYKGKRRYISIPEYIDNKKVTSIGMSAFLNNTRLRKVNLPQFLKYIKAYAFQGCTNITSIDIPSSVTYIGKCAFKDNIRLYNVNFQGDSKLEIVESEAFMNCSNLERFDIPKNVIHDEQKDYFTGNVFVGCTNLKQINASKESNYFTSIKGVLYNKVLTTIVVYPAGLSNDTFELLDSITKLGVSSFAYSNIETIDLKNVNYIDSGAFQLSKINKINITDKVTYIGSSAFRASQIKDIALGHGLTSIEPGTFYLCTNLSTINIPNTIIYLKYDQNNGGAFEKSGLEKIAFEHDSKLTLIDSLTFSNTILKTIDIPNSVVAIGMRAFYRCLFIANVNISNESMLSSIGREAFALSALNLINLPKNLYSIGEFAFFETMLEEVTIPENVKEIYGNSFASCHNLKNIFVSSNNSLLTDIDGVVYTKDYSTIFEYPAGKETTSYIIDKRVKEVGEYAFYGSYNLTSLTLPSKLSTINKYGFSNVINVNTYELPISLESIEEYAFSNNTSLEYINIPDNVTKIGKFAFFEDYNCYSIHFNDSSKIDRLSYGAFAYSGISMFGVPSNVSTISQDVFTNCPSLGYIYFYSNSKLESVSAYLFKGCNNLNTITFNDGSKLETIEAHAFEGMKNLISISFGDAKIKTIGNYAFRYCSNLTDITIPNTVNYIGRFAFYGCNALTRLDIPASVEYIGRYAFHLASQLDIYFESETLPSNVQENWDYGINSYHVGVKEVKREGDYEYAILNDGSISIVKYYGNEKNIDLTKLSFGKVKSIGGHAFMSSQVENIILPDTLTEIQYYAFKNSKLKSITIPDNVIRIGSYAFENTDLETIEIGVNSKLQYIDQYAFNLCENLNNIYLPSSLISIGTGAFRKSGLQNVIFGEDINLEEIPEECFMGTKLVNVTLPNSITLINHSAFRDIETLNNVVFGSSDVNIMTNVFYNSGLTEVNIPSNVQYIGEYSLVGLKNLKEFIVDENNKYYKAIDGALYTKDGKKIIAYPAGKTGDIVLPSSIETIGFGAFENSSLSSVVFPNESNILNIGYRAFFNADNLVEITIPSSVVSIDYYAFANCDKLETVNINSDSRLSGVYEGAFYGCISLKNIVLPDTVLEISDYSFSGCLSLEKIPVSETSQLQGIFSYAFANSGLTEVNIPETVLDIDDYSFKGVRAANIVIPTEHMKELRIGIGAFNECEYLEEITLPFVGERFEDEDVFWIGYVFGAGSYLANDDYIPSSLKKITISEGISVVRSYSFYNLDTVEELDLPYSIELLEKYAFNECNARHEFKNKIMIIIDYSIQVINATIGNNLFGKLDFDLSDDNFEGDIFIDGYDIEELTSPALKHYPYIYNCDRLKTVVIPEGTEEIYFSSCTNSLLIEVILPSTLKYISSRAFYGSTNIVTIVNKSSLDIKLGDYSCGYASIYANELIDKNGNKTILYEGYKIIDKDGFRFTYKDNKYTLVNYIGNEKNITLPNNINNENFDIKLTNNFVTSLNIPNGITSICDSAFQGCTSLANISIPDSVTYIGGSAFHGCTSLTSITIPSSVTTIDWFAFQGCTSLANVTIPDSVTTIDCAVFQGCTSLTSITIPDSVTTIGNNAFSGCTSLTNIIIPDSVEIIYSYAFSNCISLSVVELLPNKIQLHKSVFDGCISLKYIKLTKETVLLDSIIDIKECFIDFSLCDDYVKESGIIYNKDLSQIVYIEYLGQENLIIKEGINNIGMAFKNLTFIKNVIIPNSVTTVSDNAFEGCISLTNIIIPNSVTSIGNNAFKGCTSLANISIPDSVTFIGDSAFQDCTSLANISIPDSVTFIGNSAFHGCTSLTSITIPSSVTTIGWLAFEECTSLANVTIPDSVTTIGNNAFSGCTSLTNIIIPDSVTSIGDCAFEGCTSLTNILIPNAITTIGDSAFLGCTSLTSITIPDSVTTIGGCVFQDCTSLTNIIIPKSVTAIGDSAFLGCTSLTSITIPDSVTSIGRCAFEGCTSLTSIVIPESVIYIHDYAFHRCDSLFIIYNNSFLNLDFESIENGYIAYYAKQIIEKDGSTRYYDGIKIDDLKNNELVIKDDFIFTYNGIFYVLIGYQGSKLDITFPESIYGEDYFINFHSNFVQSIQFPDNFRSLKTYCQIGKNGYGLNNSIYGNNLNKVNFSNLNNLEGITLKNNKSLKKVNLGLVTTIGSSVFQDCTSLTNIIIPNSVTTIADSAFSGCTSLTSITIPDSVTFIGNSAFQGCTSLTSITIPDSVTSIGRFAFLGCTSLTSVVMPVNIVDIEKDIFENTPYNETAVWIDNALCLGNYIIKVDKNAKEFTYNEGYYFMRGALENCPYIIKVVLNKTDSILCNGILTYLSNLETLIINTNLIVSFNKYIYDSLTLKTICLTSNVTDVIDNQFEGFNGIIYVDHYKEDVTWDHDYPTWSGNNKVYYKGEWISAQFYDDNNKEITSDFYLVDQVIRQPIMSDYIKDGYKYKFIGWDLDGDGKVNSLPATSKTNIQAKAVYEKEIENYNIYYMDKDGVTILETVSLPYGSKISLITPSKKQGYTFKEWTNYPKDLILKNDIIIYSVWSHNGEHIFDETEIVSPTCTEQGYTKHICSICNEYYISDFVNALNHLYDQEETVSPTCTEQGYTKHICSRCDFEYNDNFVNKLDHSFTDYVIDNEATCLEEGLKHKVCSLCNHKEYEIIEALNHSYIVIEEKEATCSHTGSVTYKCSRCDDIRTTVLGLKEHEYAKKYVSLNWLEKVLKLFVKIFYGIENENAYYYECINCKHIMQSSESNTESSIQGVCSHNNCKWEISFEGCIDNGLKVYKCLECNKTIDLEVTEPLGHDLIHHEGRDATCLENGYKEYDTCTRCDYSTYEEIPSLGHETSDWIIDIEPTCLNEGSKHKECLRCKETLETETISSLGHDLIHHEGYDATCLENGYKEYDTCTRCSYSTFEEIPSLGHIESDWIIDKEASCLESGSKHKECLRCKETLETETISSLGHDLIHHEGQNATCLENGYKEYDTCTRCDYSTFEEIISLGHDLIHHEGRNATCLENGYKEYDTCTRCSYSTFEEIPSLGHEASDFIIDIEPTCLNEGSKHKECLRCKETLETETISSLGHDLIHHEGHDATCLENGYKEYDTCTRCDYSTFEELPSLGHIESDWIIDKEATTKHEGHKEILCERCGELLKEEAIPKLEKTGCASWFDVFYSFILFIGMYVVVLFRKKKY